VLSQMSFSSWFSPSRNQVFFFSSSRRHTRSTRDWSSDVCSSDLIVAEKLDHPFGFVAGPEGVIEFLRYNARPLMFTAALPPSNKIGRASRRESGYARLGPDFIKKRRAQWRSITGGKFATSKARFA